MKRRKPLTALATALAAVAAAAAGCTPAQAATSPTASQYQAGFAKAIATDVASSVKLPDGYGLWLGGDVTRVGAVDVTGYYGYPHGAFAETPPGSAAFTVLPGHYGTSYGTGKQYQQVPNWSDGSFFWAQAAIVDGAACTAGTNTLHVIGDRVLPGANGSFTIESTWDAAFTSSTLAFEGVTPVPSAAGDTWSSAAAGSKSGVAGYWLASQHGEAAFVPRGCEAREAYWQVTQDVLPASAGPALLATASGYDLISVQWGTTEVQKWTAATPLGPWTGPAGDGTLPQPQLDGGIVAHPELPAPSGEVLTSWAVNAGTTYDPQFRYAAR